jgi:Rrf2 family protein
MLSMKAKYGLKALLALAARDAEGPILIVDLSRREKIPQKFLESILLQLKRADILRSKKGRGGGYALDRPPEAIILGDVIRLLDGPLALVPCASLTAYQKCGDCTDEATCGIRIVMKEVRDATAGILDGTTLADLLQRQQDAGIGKGAVSDWQI